MKKIFNNKSLGRISTSIVFLVIAIIIVAIIIALVVINPFKKTPPTPLPEEPKEPEPVYEVVVSDVKFKLKEARDRGNILKGSESKNPQWQQDLTTTDRFIEVTITAENIGKENITQGSWDLDDLFDKEERHFYTQPVEFWIPEESQCGGLLKPGFLPISCTKIYEVANISTGLRVKVSARPTNVSSQPQEAFIDLVF